MLHHCKRALPMVPWRRFIVLQKNPGSLARNFWSPSRPSDFRTLIREMDRSMEKFEKEFFDHFPFRRLLPRYIPIQGIVQRGDVFRVNVDVGDFKPEEIKVSLKDNILTIHAKMERKAEDGSKYQQEFSRELTLPENVDSAALKSLLGNDGILSIEAVYKPQEKPKEIPVDRN